MKDRFIFQDRREKKEQFKNEKAWSCRGVRYIKKKGYLMECMVHGVKKGRCWIKLVGIILMKAWISCCVIWTLSHKLCGVIEGLWAGAMDEYPSYPLRRKHSLYSAPMGDRIKTSLTQAPLPQMPLQNLSIVHLSYCFLSSNLWFSDFSLECVVAFGFFKHIWMPLPHSVTWVSCLAISC